jgi:deoxycytidine triphosphate deaminase
MLASPLTLTDWIEEERLMPVLLTGPQLREAVTGGTFIKDGDPAHAEGIKYDLTLGTLILKAGSAPIDTEHLSEVERGKLVVDPNEVVFALTKERLELPKDMMAQLSPKRSISHAGILVIGGFGVDPGYHGHLLLGLYNLSSTPFRLLPGRRVIAASFYRLEEGEAGDFPVPEALDEFPPELIQTMERYKPEGSQALHDTVRRLENDLRALRDEVAKHTRWEETLDRHDKQIDNLLAGLTAEKEAREKGEDKLSQGLDKVSDSLRTIERSFLRAQGGAKVVFWLLGIVTAIAVGLGVAFAKGWLHIP